jgi:hypothetical protein
MPMRVILSLGLVAAAFLGGATVDRAPAGGASSATRLSDAAIGRCGKWAVPARIRAKAVCLRDSQLCVAALSTQYRRYGFVCQYGTLLTRWDVLSRRPLTDLRVTPGEACPVTTETGQVGRWAGLGPGPAYPMGTHSVITVLFPPPEGWGVEWSGTKRVWLLDTRYTSRALVRGRQLDGPNELRFVHGYPGFTAAKILNPVRELRIEGNDAPSLTRVRAPGCYAYQVDGRTFSYLVVFEARIAEDG